MPDSTDSEHSDPATCHLCGDRAATQAGFLLVNTRVFPHDSLCDECSMTAEEVVSVLEGTDDRQLQYLRDRGLLSPADGSTVTDGGAAMNEVECRNCGAVFDLSAQWYYDNLCPTCKAEDADDDPTRPACCHCQERYDPEAGLTARMRNSGRRGGSECVGVCSLACKHALERHRKCS